MTSRLLPCLALSLLVACGGAVVDTEASGPSGSGGAEGRPGADGATPGAASDRPAPPTPALPVPGATFVIDPAAPAKTNVPRTTFAQGRRCELGIGSDIPSALDEQSAWETASGGSRRLAGGALLGEHHFNRIIGVLGDAVFIETFRPAGMQPLFGIVTVDAVTGAVAEVVPLASDLGGLRSLVASGAALYGLRDRALVRVTGAGITTLREDASGAVLHRNGAGLFLVEPSSVWRVSSSGLALVGPGAPLGTPAIFDVHANGTVYYADGETLRRSDAPDLPIVRAAGRLASVRIDTITGDVAFTTERAAPVASSLYVLGAGGVAHVAQTSIHQVQGQETPLRVLDATAGAITAGTTCSNDEDAPDEMPVRFDATTGAASYLVDAPSYPYVKEYGWLRENSYEEIFWREDVTGVRFFVRR